MPRDAGNQTPDQFVELHPNGDKVIRSQTGRIIRVIKAPKPDPERET